jgi:RNA polymerase sigma-70 factor (ECF subfamily)
VIIVGATVTSDEELISRIREGDKKSYDTLVREYLPKTYRRVRRFVPIDDAEDVTQDIFLNLVRSLENFKGRSAFSTWFNRIIANRVADYHRKMFRQKNRFVSDDDIIAQEPYPEQINSLEIEDLLANLPEHYREVILMKVHYNLSFSDIASSLGMSYEAARSRYRRGIKYAINKIEPDLLHN